MRSLRRCSPRSRSSTGSAGCRRRLAREADSKERPGIASILPERDHQAASFRNRRRIARSPPRASRRGGYRDPWDSRADATGGTEQRRDRGSAGDVSVGSLSYRTESCNPGPLGLQSGGKATGRPRQGGRRAVGYSGPSPSQPPPGSSSSPGARGASGLEVVSNLILLWESSFLLRALRISLGS